MEELAQLITNNGFSVVLLAWMIYKDYKFNENILMVLTEVKDVLAEFRTWHAADGGKE